MCWTSFVTVCSARLPRGREVSTAIVRLFIFSEMETGAFCPRSITRISVHFARSSSNGNSPYQPWLMTVRLKSKCKGVAIVSFIFGYLLQKSTHYTNWNYKRLNHCWNGSLWRDFVWFKFGQPES